MKSLSLALMFIACLAATVVLAVFNGGEGAGYMFLAACFIGYYTMCYIFESTPDAKSPASKGGE